MKNSNIYCNQIKNNRGQLVDTWYLDEVFIKINGILHYLWRGLDQDSDEIDILVQKRKDRGASMRFFKRLLKGQGIKLLKIVTDKLVCVDHCCLIITHQCIGNHIRVNTKATMLA